MEKITQDNLIQILYYLEESDKCDHSKFLSWNNVSKNEKTNLKYVGEIKIENGILSNDSYWGVDAPIKLDTYPYFKSNILKCEKCNSLFFNYCELKEHETQDMLRLIRKKLIQREHIIPIKKAIIEYQDWDYIIYRLKDGKLELQIDIETPDPGFDVYHILNNMESEKYFENGVEEIRDRISDMKKNPFDYKVQSWR